MRATVIEVVSDDAIQVSPRWNHLGITGSRISIAGLLPSASGDYSRNKQALNDLLAGKQIEIHDYLYVSGQTLHAIIYHLDAPVQAAFPDRSIPVLEPSRWADHHPTRPISRITGGVKTRWLNPLKDLPLSSTPFWGNIAYPSKRWDQDFDRDIKLARALYSETHINHRELKLDFERFIVNPKREAPMLIIADVGTGKSWWLAHNLMSLDEDKYHVIVVDLRYLRRGDFLEASVQTAIIENLNYYLFGDLSWMHPDYAPLYGDEFDPDDPELKGKMRDKAASITDEERLHKMLRYYNNPNSPDLIVAFDNIDNFTEKEQEVVADMCIRLIGHPGGVKVIEAIRPTSAGVKSRKGLAGEAIAMRTTLLSPNVFDVLKKRVSTNNKGDRIPGDYRIGSTGFTWDSLCNVYEDVAPTRSGLASFVMELCCSDALLEGADDLSQDAVTKRGLPKSGAFDMRHYIKLFRRILFSNLLGGFQNLDNPYRGIQCLLLRDHEPMQEGDAYLFNLFDDGRPRMRGNALIRYRVLEYCGLFEDLGEIFDVYFRALGCNPVQARYILKTFEDAGFVNIVSVEMNDVEIPFAAELTTPGKQHLAIVANLWYVIAVKTGMNVYSDLILKGEEAVTQAAKVIPNVDLLEFYSEIGWVSEDGLVEYLGTEALLEDRMIGDFEATHPEWRAQVVDMVQHRARPESIVHYTYQEQLERWKIARERNR